MGIEANQVEAFMRLVPRVTDPMGKYWNQPPRGDMQLTEDDYIIMSKQTLEMLAEYSRSMPSGVYPGKMWKSRSDAGWHLCWYGFVPAEPNKCSINHRPIILKEMLDLLESSR